MPELQLHDLSFVPFISRKEIQQRIHALAAQINTDYAGKNPLVIGVLNGSFIFVADLLRELTIHAEVSFVKLSSYEGTATTGNVTTAIGLKENLHGRHVIVAEDIIDTGKTLSSFLPELYKQQPATVKIATFLTKPAARRYDVQADYTAFEIEDRFVVGYGLDYNGLGRNLPELYVLK